MVKSVDFFFPAVYLLYANHKNLDVISDISLRMVQQEYFENGFVCAAKSTREQLSDIFISFCLSENIKSTFFFIEFDS